MFRVVRVVFGAHQLPFIPRMTAVEAIVAYRVSDHFFKGLCDIFRDLFWSFPSFTSPSGSFFWIAIWFTLAEPRLVWQLDPFLVIFSESFQDPLFAYLHVSHVSQEACHHVVVVRDVVVPPLAQFARADMGDFVNIDSHAILDLVSVVIV